MAQDVPGAAENVPWRYKVEDVLTSILDGDENAYKVRTLMAYIRNGTEIGSIATGETV